MKPAGLGFVIKRVLPGWSSSPRPLKHCGTCHFLSGRRKSNHFLNGPTDTEESLISPPRGCHDPQRTSGPAQNLGHIILFREDLPRALASRAPTRETTGALTSGVEVF